MQFLAEDFQDEFLVGMGITDVKDQGEEEKEFGGMPEGQGNVGNANQAEANSELEAESKKIKDAIEEQYLRQDQLLSADNGPSLLFDQFEGVRQTLLEKHCATGANANEEASW